MLEQLGGFFDKELRILPWFAAFFVAERLLSAKRFDRKAWLFDWQYWFLWVAGNSIIMLVLEAGGLSSLRNWAIGHRFVMHFGTLHPVVKQILLLFTFDLFYYWYHRFQHTTALWPQHALHHSEPHLNAATAFRHHILENLVKVPLVDVPLMFFFVESVWGHMDIVTQAAAAFIAYLGVFAHSNLRIGYGPVAWFIISPQTHRIHHSIEERHWNKNFAAYFPFIDLVFGTYYHPARGEYPDTGLPGVGYQLNSLPAALMYPFREWRRMIARRSVDARWPHERDAVVLPADAATPAAMREPERASRP